MADTQTPTAPPPVSEPTYVQSIVDAMVEALGKATAPELMEAQVLMLQRLATQGDVVPSRIPPPLNITQIGGYLNLLEDQPELRAQFLASVLGVAGPTPPIGSAPSGPPLFFATRSNDRVAGTPAQVAAIPVELTIRSDFAGPFDAALKEIHDRGCALPVLSPVRALPRAVMGAAPPTDLLGFVGRTVELVPACALVNPDQDPLALASSGAGPVEPVARQLDAAAPRAGEVAAAAWTAFTCTATACTSASATRSYLPLTPILLAAGWQQSVPAAPTSLLDQGAWASFTNLTGLVAGRTTYGDELRLLWSEPAIAASSLRERLDWVWDGSSFAAP